MWRRVWCFFYLGGRAYQVLQLGFACGQVDFMYYWAWYILINVTLAIFLSHDHSWGFLINQLLICWRLRMRLKGFELSRLSWELLWPHSYHDLVIHCYVLISCINSFNRIFVYVFSQWKKRSKNYYFLIIKFLNSKI